MKSIRHHGWMSFVVVVSLGWGGCAETDDDQGAGADPVPASCPDFQAQVGTKHVVTGSNGSLTDHCDDNGDLVEHECVLVSQTLCEGEYCQEIWSQSDEVSSTTVACAGTCSDGVCLGRCPSEGSQVVFEAISMDGSASVRSLETGELMSCQIRDHTFASEAELDPFLTGELTLAFGPGQPLCLPGNPARVYFIDGSGQPVPRWDCFVE